VGTDGLRYVCLSDLHLGAQNSVLSAIGDDDVTVDPTRTSEVMALLFAGLRRLVDHLGPDAPRPTLVLNGDILEFALASDDAALMVFERFMDLAFPMDDTPIFDDRVLYIPGNHDHHLWETARERQYARYVRDLADEESLKAPWHVTPMLKPDRSIEAEVLTAIVRRRTHREQVSVAVVYPNLGFVDDETNQAVVFHHGHFTEPLYRLMSTLQRDLFPSQTPGPAIWDWEADNFAWIDFFWSALGRSGVVGSDVGALYVMLQRPDALDWLAGNLSRAVTGRYGPTWASPISAPLLRRTLMFALGRATPLERAHVTEPLSPRSEQGLDDYLSGPLLHQLLAEEHGHLDGPDRPVSSDRALTFVFGHTHKPCERIATPDGWKQPVKVLNTGGWVVDTVEPIEVQGAAIVLVGHDLDAVSLRLFTERADGPAAPVSVAEPDLGPSDAPSAWCQRVRDALSADEAGWAAFSRAADEAVTHRHGALTKIIDHAMRA